MQDGMRSRERFEGVPVYCGVPPVSSLVYPGSIQKDDLHIPGRVDTARRLLGRLRLVGDDGRLFAEQCIQKCRLAGIRTPYERDESYEAFAMRIMSIIFEYSHGVYFHDHTTRRAACTRSARSSLARMGETREAIVSSNTTFGPSLH